VNVIVVGAGILGLSIAYNLAKRGAEVTVLEERYPGSGISVRALGAVHSQWDNEHDIRLAKKNRELMGRLSTDLNFNILFRRDGYLMVARDKEALAELDRNASLQRSLGVDTTPLSSEEIRDRYPFLDASSIVGGTLSKGDGSMHPFSVVNGLWSSFEQQQGKVVRPTTVKTLHIEGNGVSSAETDRATYKADVYVVAAGVGSREILRTIGLDVPTQLVKHEMLATEPLRFFLKPMIQSYRDGISITQSIRGEILCQLPTRGEKIRNDNSSTLDFLEEAATELIRFIPTLREVKVLRPWAGLVETTRDFEPVTGKFVFDNLWVAFADSGKGVMFAPSIGEMMAEEILSGESNPDLEPYSPDRLLS
jgi:sarcosine oxidase subunit beta